MKKTAENTFILIFPMCLSFREERKKMNAGNAALSRA